MQTNSIAPIHELVVSRTELEERTNLLFPVEGGYISLTIQDPTLGGGAMVFAASKKEKKAPAKTAPAKTAPAKTAPAKKTGTCSLKVLGGRIKRARYDSGLSFKEFAAKGGVCQSGLSRWERGLPTRVTDKVRKALKKWGVSDAA